MTPMIDVVFQLLVFFLFSFKIIPVEGEIGVNMPPLTLGARPSGEQINPTEKVRIKLVSDAEGELLQILLEGTRPVGSIKELSTILSDTFVPDPAGLVGDVEVEIDADRKLYYQYVIRVTNAVQNAGINKINFTDPQITPPSG